MSSLLPNKKIHIFSHFSIFHQFIYQNLNCNSSLSLFSQQIQSMFLLFSCALVVLLPSCIALDTIIANQAMKDGNTMVSLGGKFELGFFSPGKSKNRYVGIWYNDISVCTPVWVANRETPIADQSGIFKVTSNGKLIIASGGNTKIWMSNSSLSVRNSIKPMARLLDTGNLVVLDKSRSSENPIWQSFDYPCDTLLPGMKFGKDLVTGLERSMISWKGPDDPSNGEYIQLIDTNGYPQMFVRKGKVLQSRIGPWHGLGFSGRPIALPNPVNSQEFFVNEKEIYFRFELKSLVKQHVHWTWDGKVLHRQWVERIQKWVVCSDMGMNSFNHYGVCGPYGISNINRRPLCSCMRGFEPRLRDEWEASDWSSGCQRKKPLDCKRGDGFQKISGVKFPDTRRSRYNASMSLAECEMACRTNCSCTAYANLDIRNSGSGCLLWFDELMDTEEYDGKEDLYIRMAASDLEESIVQRFSYNHKKNLVTVVVSTSSAVLLLFSVVAYACKKGPYMRGRGSQYALDKKNDSVLMEDVDELPFFTLDEIAKATHNFSIHKQIGEGGFGPVYKGELENGQEVAIKRLSETSQQGLEEFKNEIICISKLQHRNLVKLLGYCIHGNEMILIYEYMTNGSLDSFLFGGTRESMLDWPQRFHIIQGIARGVLYLHQDSRLQIIHRDLKASNILLDANMNPKISDFGLARNFVGLDTAVPTKKVVGTYGYISPEYAVHGRFSTKSDVFSFGVLVLEMVSGKRNREFSHEDHNDNLLGHAWRLYRENRSSELMNASLGDSCIISEVLRSIQVGLLCVQQNPKDRPTMMSVVLMLVSEGVLPQPKQPAFFTGESQSQSEFQITSSVDENMITQVNAR